MSTRTHSVDVAPRRRFGAAQLALVLGILSIPGSLLPWDWFTAGGLVIGIPPALAAVLVGLSARRAAEPASATARTALAGMVLGVAALLIPVAYVTASAFSG